MAGPSAPGAEVGPDLLLAPTCRPGRRQSGCTRWPGWILVRGGHRRLRREHANSGNLATSASQPSSLPFLRHPARSPALLAWLFGERYGFGPPWRVTRRCLLGGISMPGDRSPEGAVGLARAVSDRARRDQAWRNVRQPSMPPNPMIPGSGQGRVNRHPASAPAVAPAVPVIAPLRCRRGPRIAHYDPSGVWRMSA